jgi:hypothetical protein
LRRSDDGITWTDAKMVHNIVLPERVSVGLVASNSTNTELTAAFDNLHLRGKATSPEAPGAWVQLFNGKDLTNWNPHPNWRVEKNILVGAGPLGPGKNAFLATERVDYADFHLRAEVRVHNQEADGGIFVRSNFHEKLTTPSWCEANIGFGPKRQKEHTGSLAVHKVNAKAGDPWIAAPADLAKPGEWFVLEVIAIGQHITSKVNGKIAAETRNAGVHPRGQIVLQAFGEKTVVQFKTVEIKELPPEEPGWVHLFNGKDLTGWENAAWAKTPWIVENGNLVGKGHTALTFDKAYKNFHCRLEAKINDGAWSALHFRRAPSGDVCTVIAHQHNTGGLWFVKHGEKNRRLFNPTKDDWATPDTWLTVEVIAINQNVTILVNGAKTTEMKVEEMAASGGLMLISGAETTTMTVRKIEIKELPPEEPGWVQLFNGKDLSGWQGDPDVWSWKDDLLIGTAVKKDSDKGNAKGFDLRSEKSFKDFELKFKARLDSFGGLAGVLFRGPAGMPIAPTRQMGKFEPRYTVAKSGKFLPGTLDWNELEKIIKPGFNHFHLRCEGKRVTLKLNGITTLDNEAVPELADEGPIVFRVYWASNTTTSVSFRDIRIREIKSPE